MNSSNLMDPAANHFSRPMVKGLDPFVEFCSQGPAFTGMKKLDETCVRISLTFEAVPPIYLQSR